ncbi:Hypothetical protein D9617_1g079400 [Elsinoe fawcettii]|nr:Hypothetical protein D9617_1g079400 [Elsinoe fawcettii]
MDLDDLFKAAREEPGALPLIEDKDIYQKQIKVIRTWQLFAREVYQDDADLESYLELRKPPSVSCMKAFLRYLVRTRKGRVGKRPNLRTMKGNWHMIRTLIRKRSNCDISKLSIDIGHFIRQLPTLENASTKAKEKPLASPEVVIDVIDFLWRFDEYAFKTEAPRWRLQISFALLLMLFFGLRPGEFTDNRSDNKRKDENDTLAIGDGFKYGDFEPIAIAQDGGIRWVLKVRLRLRKGVRHIQASNVYFLLKQNLKHPRLCPVYHFFGFALADGALDQIRDAAQLSRVNVPPGRAAMPLKVRPSHQDIPVLQARDVGQKFCRSKFMPSNALNTALTMLGDRAGYQQSLTAYAIRRGHANTIDAQITTAQRLNRMGHSSASIFNSYISSTSVVDTQAIILGDDQESEVFDFSRSMQLNRDTTAPMPMSSRLTGIGAMKRPKELPYKERYRHADQRRAFRSRRGEHEENLSLFFDDCSDTEALPGRLPDTRQQSPYLRALLRCDRSRGDIAKLTEDEDSDGASFGSTLRIFELNARTTPMYHYPGVTPDVTGKCVFCEKDIHSWKGNA